MENQIKQSLERIQLPPGAEARLQERIDAALDRPMRKSCGGRPWLSRQCWRCFCWAFTA